MTKASICKKYQCHGRTQKNERCAKEASCKIGCTYFCWIHADVHAIGQSCVDFAELEPNELHETNVKSEKKSENKKSMSPQDQKNNINILVEKVYAAIKNIDQLVEEYDADIEKISTKLDIPVMRKRRRSANV